jgi:6-phosphogluconolactonase
LLSIIIYENEKQFAILLLVLFCSSVAQNNSFNLLIGTYTNGCDSKGMYVYDFDSDTGDFNFKNVSKHHKSSYLTVSK